ncbi:MULTISPECIES: pesticin C-terminus-like muramidase [unclassified Zymobacter]|uniref:pesticin C-terminus-like muramidase n=1 Tax=unclassified Zymobacter TaxID=3048685 RepID=UPI0039C2F0D0
MLEPTKGLFTFRAEGSNTPSSTYYSRKIHWPGKTSFCTVNNSGVTIGRGYDLGSRIKSTVYMDLINSGADKETAEKISEGAGLHACSAMQFVADNRDKIKEISEQTQLNLFNLIYPGYEDNAKGFYHRQIENRYKKDKTFPKPETWDNLDGKVKEIFVDVFYQGQMSLNFAKLCSQNNRKSLADFIESSSKYNQYENGRHRAKYLRE